MSFKDDKGDIVRMALEVISKPISTMANDCKQIILFDLSLH